MIVCDLHGLEYQTKCNRVGFNSLRRPWRENRLIAPFAHRRASDYKCSIHRRPQVE